jgi:hypothetical protein
LSHVAAACASLSIRDRRLAANPSGMATSRASTGKVAIQPPVVPIESTVAAAARLT